VNATTKNAQPQLPSGAAFTMVELLVVIAIIALLAALFLPVLARSRLSAQRLTCVSNLHQFGLACQLYWDDNGNRTFRYRGAVTNGGVNYWFGWIENGAEGTRTFDPKPGALYPYLASRGIQVCPAFNYAMRQLKLKANGTSYGYGYNLQLSAPSTQPPVSMNRVRAQSQTVLLADAGQINTFQAPASPSNPLLEEFYYVTTNEPTTHFRHVRTSNVLFCDGHVGREKPVPASVMTNLPGQTLGWLRTELLVVP